MAKTYEYARFGEGWVRRSEGTADDWKECAEKDVPSAQIAGEMLLSERQAQVAQGIHPDGGVQFAKFVRKDGVELVDR